MTTTADLDEPSVLALPVAALGPIAPPRSVTGEALRYLAASAAALALDAGLLWLGVERVGLAPWVAGAVAYATGLVLIYGLSVRWVFRARTVGDRKAEFVVFATLGLVGLFLNSVTLFVATSLGLALPFAKALSAGIGFVANFVSRKVLLFSTTR